MSTAGLIFASENGRSTPRLRPRPGFPSPWTDDELRELEAELNRKYSDLSRGNVETVTFQSRVLKVEVQPNGRTPTLVLTEAAEPIALASAAVAPTAVPPLWLDGLLSELDRVVAAHPDANIPPLEASMLRMVADELRQLSAKAGAGEVAVLLLAGHLRAAEGLFRAADLERATVYTMAQRALEKVLERLGEADTGWVMPRGKAGGTAPTGVVGRWLRKLFGVAPSASGTH